MADSRFKTLTIANGATSSDAFGGSDYEAYGLQMPSAFTGTSITFTVSADGGTTFQALYDLNNNLVTMTIAASRSYDLPGELTTWTHFKIVSGSSEGGTRSLVVVGKRS